MTEKLVGKVQKYPKRLNGRHNTKSNILERERKSTVHLGSPAYK